MTRKREALLARERMDATLPTLIEYFAMSKQVKGCSPKTLLALRSNLGKFMKFLESRGHSLKLSSV